MYINEKFVIEKNNILNEMRTTNMKIQELRFFSIYLSRINSRDSGTRLVRFSISDFQKIMDFGRINIKQLEDTANSLLCKVVKLRTSSGGFNSFQLFKECKVDTDKDGEWYFEIDAHDKALPLMFEFKEKYFTYHLWNALKLKSSNQLRMYEILKQYEAIGERIIKINVLKELIGISEEEYPRWDNFKAKVLDSCQKALLENTDISFTYEPCGKKGKGGKILYLKFKITKNKNYVDQLTLEKFINQKDFNATDVVVDEHKQTIYDERINFLSDACNNEFSVSEIIVLYNLMIEHLSYSLIHDDIKCYDYLNRKYNELNMRSEKTKILKRFNYLKSIIGKE